MFSVASFKQFVALFSMSAVMGISHSEAAAASVVTVDKFNCSQPQIFNNFDIGNCCRLPVINMDAAITKCHQEIKSLKSYNNKYPVYAHVCYPECIYRETNALKANGDILMENVEKFLTMNIEERDKIIVPTIVESFRTCLNSLKQKLQTAKGIKMFSRLTELDCSPYASMVYGCVNTETFLHCPPQMWQRNESSCSLAKNFIQQCNPLPHVFVPTI